MSLFNELKRRNVIRVAIAYLALAWLVTEVAGTLFPAFGIPDWGIRFLVIVFALGFVPTLIISWAYEITPEGLKREKDVVRDTSITHLTAKRLDVFTIGLVVVAISFILADRFWLSPRISGQSAAPAAVVTDTMQTSGPESQYPPNSIAVLPFVNMSDDPDNEYFSDGISEELLNLLAEIPELRVIARTSSFSYKGKDAKIPDIARELNVVHILEGSVRKSANQVRITAQLIRASNSSQMWSATYDRTLDNIFTIQDDIASEVVSALKVNLLGETVPKSRETVPEAYARYLQGRYHRLRGDLEGLRKAEKYLRESLAVDPNYAPAWVTMSRVYRTLAINGWISFNEGYLQSRNFLIRALELDPDFGRTHSGLGWIAMMYDRDLPTAAMHFHKALALAPNDPEVLGDASVFAETLGRFDRTFELGERAIIIDPLSSRMNGNLAIVYSYIGQFEQAEAKFAKAFEFAPDNQLYLPWLAKMYLLQGKPDKALSAAGRIEFDSRRLWILPMAYHDLGQTQASEEALATLKENHANEAASFIAENYAWRGEIDHAFEWLDRAINEKQYIWGSLVFDPAFINLHNDPRWVTIREKDGRSEEQLNTIEF